MSGSEDRATTTCGRCRAAIEICACCDQPGCGASLCYACVSVLVRPAPPALDDDDC
jgi:hypothetical protein